LLFNVEEIVCEIKKIFEYTYNLHVGEDMIENEYLHLFLGKYNGDIKMNANEVIDFEWVDLNEINYDLKLNGERYTPWFRLLYPKVYDYLQGSSDIILS